MNGFGVIVVVFIVVVILLMVARLGRSINSTRRMSGQGYWSADDQFGRGEPGDANHHGGHHNVGGHDAGGHHMGGGFGGGGDVGGGGHHG